MSGILIEKEKDKDLKIYVAGSLKNSHMANCVMKDIESMGCQIAVDWAKDIDVTECIKGLEQCDGLIFCMDGFKSRGKNFELGYVHALKKPIIVYPIYPFKESIEDLLENESTFLKLFPIIKSRDDIKDWITNLKEKKK